MQRAAVQGNLDARRLDTANSIARAWLERVRRDAMLWDTATNINNTVIINNNLGSGWVMPSSCPASGVTDGLCSGFDAFGHDLDTGHYPNAVFCSNIKLDVVAKDTSNTNPTVVRAVVRVYWPKGLSSASNGVAAYSAGGAGFCSTAGLADGTSGPDAPNGTQIYHFVQATTLLTNSPVPQ
jgi:hypothetical protein